MVTEFSFRFEMRLALDLWRQVSCWHFIPLCLIRLPYPSNALLLVPWWKPPLQADELLSVSLNGSILIAWDEEIYRLPSCPGANVLLPTMFYSGARASGCQDEALDQNNHTLCITEGPIVGGAAWDGGDGRVAGLAILQGSPATGTSPQWPVTVRSIWTRQCLASWDTGLAACRRISQNLFFQKETVKSMP